MFRSAKVRKLFNKTRSFIFFIFSLFNLSKSVLTPALLKASSPFPLHPPNLPFGFAKLETFFNFQNFFQGFFKCPSVSNPPLAIRSGCKNKKLFFIYKHCLTLFFKLFYGNSQHTQQLFISQAVSEIQKQNNF